MKTIIKNIINELNKKSEDYLREAKKSDDLNDKYYNIGMAAGCNESIRIILTLFKKDE